MPYCDELRNAAGCSKELLELSACFSSLLLQLGALAPVLEGDCAEQSSAYLSSCSKDALTVSYSDTMWYLNTKKERKTKLAKSGRVH
eukprot:1146596-Pelagomonas_calceolata.AAC.4